MWFLQVCHLMLHCPLWLSLWSRDANSASEMERLLHSSPESSGWAKCGSVGDLGWLACWAKSADANPWKGRLALYVPAIFKLLFHLIVLTFFFSFQCVNIVRAHHQCVDNWQGTPIDSRGSHFPMALLTNNALLNSCGTPVYHASVLWCSCWKWLLYIQTLTHTITLLHRWCDFI